MNLSRTNLRLKRRSKLKRRRRRTWLLSRYGYSLFVSFSRIPFLHLKIVVPGLFFFFFATSWPTTHPNFQFFIVLDTLSEEDTVFRPMAYGSPGTSFPGGGASQQVSWGKKLVYAVPWFSLVSVSLGVSLVGGPACLGFDCKATLWALTS